MQNNTVKRLAAARNLGCKHDGLSSAIARAKEAVRLLDAKLDPESRRRRWEMPECVIIAIMKALHPELGTEEVAEGLENGTLRVPREKYRYENVRRAAILAFVERMGRMGKKPIEISDEDFRRNGLAGLVNNRFGSSFEALKWAGVLSERERRAFVFKNKPWTFSNRENRVKELREAAEALGREPKEIRLRDFRGPFPKVYAMVINYYRGSVFEAFTDAGLVQESDEAHMRAKQKEE